MRISYRISWNRRKRPDKMGKMDKFAGYLYCGDCGKRMFLHRGKTIRPENNTFQCGGYQKSKHNCTVHSIKEIVMDTIVLDNLKKVTLFARSEPEKFYELAIKRGKAEALKIEKNAEKERATAEARIQKNRQHHPLSIWGSCSWKNLSRTLWWNGCRLREGACRP